MEKKEKKKNTHLCFNFLFYFKVANFVYYYLSDWSKHSDTTVKNVLKSLDTVLYAYPTFMHNSVLFSKHETLSHNTLLHVSYMGPISSHDIVLRWDPTFTPKILYVARI